MENNDSNIARPSKVLAPEDKRTVELPCKVTPKEAAWIRQTAKDCNMTVSSLLRTRVLGFTPAARLTQEEKDLITQLSLCRSDIANFINAVNGLTAEEKRRLFHNRQLMYHWYNEVKPISDAVSDFIKEIRTLRCVPERTTNKMMEEQR